MDSDESHEGTIARGAGFVLVGTFVGMGASFLIRTLLIRGLPKGEYGLFALALSATGLAATFGTLGLRQGAARAVARADDEDSVRDIALTALSSVSVVTLTVAVVMFGFSGQLAETVFREPEVQPYLEIMSVIVPATAVLTVVISIFRGIKSVRERVVVQNFVSPVGRGLLAVTAVSLGYGAVGVATGWVVGLLIALAVGVYYLYRRTAILSLKPFDRRYRSLLLFSLPLMVSSATWTVVQQADNFLLGVFSTSSDVAVYDSAFLTGKLIIAVLGAFGFLFMPIFSDLEKEGNTDRMQSIYHSVTEWMVLLTFPFYVGTVLAPDLILSVLFKPSYASASTALSIIASGFFFHIVSGSSGYAMIALGRNRIVLGGNVGAGILNVVLNVAFIPRFGITGAAAASAVSYVFFNLYYLAWLYRLRGFTPFNPSLVKPILLSLPVVSVLWIVAASLNIMNELVVLACLFSVFSLHFLIVLNSKNITEGDERLLAEVESKIGVDLRAKFGFFNSFGDF